MEVLMMLELVVLGVVLVDLELELLVQQIKVMLVEMVEIRQGVVVQVVEELVE